jgi:hypothetical protein
VKTRIRHQNTVNMTEGTKATITSGCSKRLSSKAAASEEAEAYASVR